MKLKKLAAVVFSIGVLTACSGGGSGSAETPDGTKVNLTNSDKGLIGGKTDQGKLIGYNQDYSFYGAWLNDGKTFSEIRYQGTETDKNALPKGSATYVGNAVRYSNVRNDIQVDGKSRLDVNFDKKTVSGYIDMPDARDITLHETAINGSKFAGNASVLLNNGGSYEGGFFGPNAEEAAGIVKFENNGDLTTSFGGKR